MIIETRTYKVQPGSVAEAEKRFGATLNRAEGTENLVACWHTEVGPLNQLTHVWTFSSFEQRSAVRALAQEATGLSSFRELVVREHSELFLPAPFCPALQPRDVGPLFEIRQYTLSAGSMPGLIERWSQKIEARTKFSPLVGAWYSEFGVLNKWVHIWGYKNAAERFRVRDEAKATGEWPARNPQGVVLNQETAFVMPAAYSPIR